MTCLYTCRGQDTAHFARPVVVMKWTHPKCFDEDFLSEWQATENVCELAMDFDHYISYQGSTSGYSKKEASALRDRRVHFNSSLDVAIGTNEDFSFEVVSMPLVTFMNWTGKPWRLNDVHRDDAPHSFSTGAKGHPVVDPHSVACISRPAPGADGVAIIDHRTTDNFHNVPSRWERPGELRDGDADMNEGDTPAFLHEAPGSIQTMYDRFLDDGYIDGPRLEDSIYLRSWYLHHVNQPLWHRPRTIELQGHWRHWMRDVLNGWVDQILEDQEVELYLCSPQPPRAGDFTYDLLVVQGVWSPRLAGLTTVLRLNDPAARAQFAVAASFTPFVSGNQIAVTVNMDQHCQFQTCTIRHRRTVIPYNMDPVHEMTNGDTFTVNPHASEAAPAVPAAGDDDAGSSHHDPPPREDPERSEHGDDPPTPMNESCSGFSSDEDPQGVHIYRFGHFPVFGYADWTTYHTILRDAAQMVRLRINQIPAFHFVRARLDGLQEAEEAIIVQHIHDIPVGSLEKLVIIDVKMHTRNQRGQVPHPPLVKRQVYRVLPQLTRSHILIIAGVDAYCAWVQDQCVVHLNNEPWEQRDPRLREIQHGVYVKIEVPPPPEPHWNTAAAIRVAQDVGAMLDPSEAGSLISQVLAAEFEDPSIVLGGGRMQQNKPCEIEEDIDVPMTFPPGTRGPSRRPHLDGDWTWLTSLVNIFAAEATTEVIDGAPLLYIQTWFVHHDRHPRCEHPRPIRIDNNIIAWIDELRHTWRDRWDRNIPFTVHIVRPRPPQPRHYGYACHVLLEQAKPANRAAGVITHLFEGPDRDAIQQYATTLPNIVRSQDVVDTLRLQLWCDFRRCSFSVGGQPLTLVVAQELHSGFNICIKIGAVEQQLPVHPQAPIVHFEDIAFLQLSAGKTNSLHDSAVASFGLPGHHEEPAPFAFNPMAPPFDPVQPDLRTQDEFTQSLHSEWEAVAFSWEGEERSCEVYVWFADHRAPMPHGNTPRRVRLRTNFGHWEQLLRNAWFDHIDPNANLEFHLVEPAPPLLEAGVAAHVILVQNPNEAWVTTLVTLFDFTYPAFQGRYFRRAVTTGEHIYLEHLVMGMDFAGTCILRPSQFQCAGWYGAMPLLLGRPLPGRSGYGIVVRVTRTPRYHPPREMPQSQPIIPTLRLEHLLHEDAAVRQAEQLQIVITHFLCSIAEANPEKSPVCYNSETVPPDILRVDMNEVYQQLATFDNHFLVPHFHLGQWNGFMPWLETWWDCQTPVTAIWIYHDGAHRAEGNGAAAVAFLHQRDRGWAFGGALSLALGTLMTSYGAELRGGLLAIQFCIDLLKVITHIQKEPPEIWLLHDNTAVGNQITGKWNANADTALAALMRHLTVYAEHRFQCRVQTQYVAAHRGDPGNELADGLAGEAAIGNPLADLTPWLMAITHHEFCDAAAWFWLLFSQHFTPWWRGSDLCLPATAVTTPTSALLPSSCNEDAAPLHGTWKCTIATCNVLTLKTGRGPKHVEGVAGMNGPTRQQIIFQQFKDANVCIFALQETRLRRSCKSLLGYQIYKGDASVKGHHGVLIAVSTELPYGTYHDAHGKQRDLVFAPNDMSLISADSRYLLLRLKTPWIRCLLIAGHAPHSGYEQSDLESWWSQLAAQVPVHLRDWPAILLVDANAKVGADACLSIGTFGAEEGTDKAIPFTSFVREHQMWLPSTFHCHQGPTGTWRHPSGKWTRNDYVGLPRQWQITACSSWVADDIDVSLHHEDHKAALVSFEMPLVSTTQRRTAIVHKIIAETADLQSLRGLVIAPTTDVHTHAAQLQDQILNCLPRSQRSGPRKLKHTMSSATWELVLQKRECRNVLRELNDLQRQTHLQACFVSWKEIRDAGYQDAHSPADPRVQFCRLICAQDHAIAQTLAEFRRLGRLVTSCSRHDDVHFYETLLAEGASYLAPAQSRDLWKIIKRNLPKYKNRRLGLDPLRMMSLEDEWNPHFEELEAGCVITPDELMRGAQHCQPDGLHHAVPSCGDLPTLFEFERALRANKPGRATGYDPLPSALYHNHAAELAEHTFPLLLKVWIWGMEPIQYKGGPMALIPKRAQPSIVQHYRGILLLPTLAKGMHALLRKRIMALLHHQRLPGQLGGFAQQEVLFGSHTLRVLGRTAQAHHFSIGVLFVDLSTAFHSLIREMVVGIGDPDELCFVLQALRWSTDAQQRLNLGRELPCLMAQLGAPPYLVRLLQNVHDSTWTTINGQDFIRTHRGTRPGSPIADAIFHYIMFDFSMNLKAYLDEAGHTSFVSTRMQMETDMIIWSDDLAVPIVTETAVELLPALLRLLNFVKKELAARGFRINLAKGKTGIVATFCGAGAADIRREYQLTPQPGISHQFDGGDTHFVHMTPTYRHLGTLYTSDQQLDAELATRTGIAVSAFEQIRRGLLANRHLPLRLRLQLFRSQVLSKLYFAAGTWHTPTGRQCDRLRAVLARMLKKIFGQASHGLSGPQLLAKAEVCEPRVQIAMDRLLYAQRVFHHGPSFLQLMLHSEAAQCEYAWLKGLRYDLVWLHGVEATADPTLLASDLTDLIDYWQRDTGCWKRRIKRAGVRHLFQEEMICEAQQWHADIFDVLRQAAFTFQPDPTQLHVQECFHQCPDCPRWFTTPQGVHTHRRNMHGIFCPEHHLLDSATCPACLTYVWSTQRLQQHLAYMPRDGSPNACFAYLQEIGYAVAYSAEHLPHAMTGQSRRDALSAAGPFGCGPTAAERRLADLTATRATLAAEYAEYEQPHNSLDAGARLGDLLTMVTQKWYHDFVQAAYRFEEIERPQDRWIDVLCQLPSDYESWTARVFILWGRHTLPDLIAELMDGEAEAYLDGEYAELVHDFDEYQMEERLRKLDHLIRQAARRPDAPAPHRPIRPPQENARPRSLPQLEVVRLFDRQEQWQQDFGRVRWEDMPPDPQVPLVPGLAPRPTFIIVHLFAGRRRDTDFHAWLDQWAGRWNVSLTIVSLDTAISPVLSNLECKSETWQKVQELYLQGLVAATLSGHPCETFSSARWTPPPEGHAQHRWPRPLRTAMQLFGLDHRTFRELRQTRMGTAFFLQTLWTMACHLAFGGFFIEEHPGTPHQAHHPSIWKSSIMQVLRQHPDVKFHEIGQWRFGATTVKPTGLLALRLPFFLKDLYLHADAEARRPTTHAIGLDEDGAFRTSCHKEYPPRLSAGLANVVGSQLLRNQRSRQVRATNDVPLPLARWITDVSRDCTEIRADKHWLPDYQG